MYYYGGTVRAEERIPLPSLPTFKWDISKNKCMPFLVSTLSFTFQNEYAVRTACCEYHFFLLCLNMLKALCTS
jgi:hypothetical protein